MAQALIVGDGDGVARLASLPREGGEALDSIHVIVGWTLGTVLAFWTPLAVLVYMFA